MTRPAAGGAGGRRAAAPDSDRTRSRPRALLPVVLLPVLLTTVGVVAPAAAAAPHAAVPVLAAAPADETVDPDRPVRLEVNLFEPRTVTPGSLIRVKGTVVNTGSAVIEDLDLRLQRGDVLLSRAELAAEDADPDPSTSVVLPFQRLAERLEAGESSTFDYTVDSTELRLERDGVYPVLLNVNGSIDGDTRRVGELSTFVVQQPLQPTARTAVAWLWPLTEKTHRTASGRFADDELAESIADEGRLDRALGVVERLPGSSDTPTLPITLAIDPALVEELQIMAAGEYEVPGGRGSGTEEARDYLRRLRDMAAAHPVVALPYGDVDIDSLETAGLGDVVTRSLPGTPAGTAQDPPGTPAGATTDAPLPPAGESGAPADVPVPEEGAGARILAEALDVEPRTDLAWAPGGSLLPGALERLRGGGIDQVVLGPDAVTTGDSAVGLTDATAAAAVTVGTAGGPMPGLVADSRLTAVVGGSQLAAGGPRLAEQRYLAELAVLTSQAAPDTEQTVLVTAPRDVDAGPEGAGAMMADTTSQPWLRPIPLESLSTGPFTEDGDLLAPADPLRLDTAGLLGVTAANDARNDLAGAVEGDAATALQAFDAATARATSVAWWDDPTGFRDAAADLTATMQRMRGQVTLLAPADGTYTLASSDAPLVLTVRNDLPFAVRVLPEVRARGNRALSIGDIGVRVLAPGERAVLQVPTSLGQSGGFAVTATLTTPGGSPLGERVQLQVRSTAYGPISLIITFGAASLLGLLFLRRLVRFVLRRRARTGGADDAGVSLGPDGTPTRSPV
ncbi:hypothetical protein SAMN05660748_4045 [Blastococcus aggregatus]|uniref:Glycoprotein n=1 Tax=Blastococcus aggregatus TaxID=38502 RepID=A0A285VE11_9ACTN|nr:DUF6049 family protein [Blastococcus aggregatus]SOC52355.1 hypothetical protein SAMN05660748_4045 [Blastococcus aggregatus]